MKKYKKIKNKDKKDLIDNIKNRPFKKIRNENYIRNDIKKFKSIFNHKSKQIIFFIIIIIQLITNIYLFIKQRKYQTNNFNIEINDEENIENIDNNILSPIQDKLKTYIEINLYEQKFLNGIVRKYKPKKIVEIGVSQGGTAVLMLNAIKDLKDSKLYSIDRNEKNYRHPERKTGWIVKEKFPYLSDKWKLYIGNTAEHIESIGNNIDFVYIDTVHTTPGEMLNWLEVLPFLKEEAIVVIHDTFFMFTEYINPRSKANFSNNQLLCYIRGNLILPKYGNKIFSRNIGAVKLSKNQKNYYKQYFLALGNFWEYFPKEDDIIILRNFYKKYYGEKLVEIFDDAVEKNRRRLK